MTFEHFETSRLKLRLFTPEVQQFVFNNLNDQELMQFLGCQNQEELDSAKNKFKGGHTTYRTSFLSYHLIRKDTNELIGYCGYHNWFAEHERSEIGYHIIDDKDKGFGLMSEAMDFIIPYGFNEMKLNRIEAWVSPTNQPSLALMKKYNFIQEGISKQHWMVNGKLDDSITFALLKREWEKNKSTKV